MITIDNCSNCKYSHHQKKDGWLPSCDAFPDGKLLGVKPHYVSRKRECANGVGFEIRTNDAETLRLVRMLDDDPWLSCKKTYAQTGAPAQCPHCHEEKIQIYEKPQICSSVKFYCSECGWNHIFNRDRFRWLNQKRIRYIGNNPAFPLTNGKIYVVDWIEYGMYLVCDDKKEEYLYPLYVFESCN